MLFNSAGGYVFIGLLAGVGWLATGLRLYTRFFIVKKPAWDDLLVLMAMCSYSVFTGFACGLLINGFSSTDDVDPTYILQRVENAAFCFYLMQIFFVIASTLTRVTCGIMLLRISLDTDTVIRRIVIVTTSAVTVYSVAFLFIVIFQCWPVELFWHHSEGLEGSCMRHSVFSALFTAHGGVCVLADWILGAIPFFLLRRAKLDFKKKCTVIILLSLGVVAGSAALVRGPLTFMTQHANSWDVTVPFLVTAAVEPTLGQVAVCAATLLPLFSSTSISRYSSWEIEPVSGNSQKRRASTMADGAEVDERRITIATSWTVETDGDPEPGRTGSGSD